MNGSSTAQSENGSGGGQRSARCPHGVRNSLCLFCTGLPAEKQARIFRALSSFALGTGEVLFREGEKATGVWSVCSGQIRVYKTVDEGHVLVTRIADPGGLVGHRAVLADTPLSASGSASEPTKGVFLSRGALEELFATEPAIRATIMRRLAEDLEHAESLAASMAYNDARSRVLAALAEFRRVRERVVGTLAGWEFAIPRKDLAELTGLTVEAVVRTLKKLEADGVVEISGRRIRVVRPGTVREQCLHHCSQVEPYNGERSCRCVFEPRTRPSSRISSRARDP